MAGVFASLKNGFGALFDWDLRLHTATPTARTVVCFVCLLALKLAGLLSGVCGPPLDAAVFMREPGPEMRVG